MTFRTRWTRVLGPIGQDTGISPACTADTAMVGPWADAGSGGSSKSAEVPLVGSRWLYPRAGFTAYGPGTLAGLTGFWIPTL